MSEFAGAGTSVPGSFAVGDGEPGTGGGRAAQPDYGPKAGLAQVEQWLARAQPNARLIYFTGDSAGDGIEAVNDRLKAEQRRGMVFLVQQRRGPGRSGLDYVAVRSSRPATAERTRRPMGLHDQAQALFKRGGR